MRIADHIAEYMREHDIRALMWGDGSLVNAAREHISGNAGSHPLNVMTAASKRFIRKGGYAKCVVISLWGLNFSGLTNLNHVIKLAI